ncbi:MAG TPA: carbon-nitrogen hydrolase family protein [Steroidobacteraceae bacterium]|jgi:predicted amidohydrolase|nr:carbon-nitrogen hydrolase family protein [Steroidobacteraceae bacterium]
MNNLKIALLQLSPVPDAPTAMERGLAACEEAASQGADIALFPEMWSNGYAMFDHRRPDLGRSWMDLAVGAESKFVTAFRDAARKLRMAIGITFLEKAEPRPLNSFRLFDREGRPVLSYSKVHICTFGTEAYCSPGAGFSVAPLETARGPVSVGAMICFDREFPESARVLALLGAEIVLVPNACVFDDHRMNQMKTRAFENKVALAMTNYPDTHADGNGRSLAISPVAWRLEGDDPRSKYSETLLLQTGPKPGIYYCEFDLDDIRHYRENAIWGLTHRRPEAYADIADERLVPAYRDNERLIH